MNAKAKKGHDSSNTNERNTYITVSNKQADEHTLNSKMNHNIENHTTNNKTKTNATTIEHMTTKNNQCLSQVKP